MRIHIPFGLFLIIRGDVVHGGVFGSPGNIRLHVVFKENGLDSSKLLYMDDINKRFPNSNHFIRKIIENNDAKDIDISSPDENYQSTLSKAYKADNVPDTIFNNLIMPKTNKTKK